MSVLSAWMVKKYSKNVDLGSSDISVGIIISGSLWPRWQTRENEDQQLLLKEFSQNEAKIEHPTFEPMSCIKPS